MNRKITAIIYPCEDNIKIVRCRLNKPRTQFLGLDILSVSGGPDDLGLSDKLSSYFKKSEAAGARVILALPRSQATSRLIKVPGSLPHEIEGMISLQARRYLPYPADELIIGYQKLFSDKEGYSHINLILLHKDSILRYINIFGKLNISELDIFLSTCGIVNLHSYINKDDPGPTMIMDIDTKQAELTVSQNKKMVFSRYFKFDPAQANWQAAFIDEVNKTLSSYTTEAAAGTPLKRIVILGDSPRAEEISGILRGRLNITVETLPYLAKLGLARELSDKAMASQSSLAVPFGLGVGEIPPTLSLLPKEAKDDRQRNARNKEKLSLSLTAFAIILIWAIAIAKTLDNKGQELTQLKTELNKISQAAKPLEEIDKRMKLLRDNAQNNISVLETLFAVHKIIPGEVSLVNFIYEQNNQITLRGKARELNNVFSFASGLEEAQFFKGFNVKVKYATQRKSGEADGVDFEIVCAKKG